MKNTPLTHVLLKIFATGFYRAHGGVLFFLFLMLFGLVEPNQLLSYHTALMLAFISSPLMMGVVFLVWLLYTFKSWHYVNSQIFAQHQHFLFYSSNACDAPVQFYSWLIVQFTVCLPVLVYGLISVGVAIAHKYFLSALVIMVYLAVLLALSALFYRRQVNSLVDGSSQSWMLKLSKGWRKPYYSLYVLHVFDKMKVTWLITKGLSYLIINGVFLLFADVSHDLRVAGIAVLAIAVSHSYLIFEERRFEQTFLIFSRNLPYTRIQIFASFALVYLVLLLPETAWLFSRFNPFLAFSLVVFVISVMLLYHSLLYRFGTDMEKYLTWVMGLFMLIFWLMMFSLIWLLVPVILLIGFWVFYGGYYRDVVVEK